jgi:hypothetical protein
MNSKWQNFKDELKIIPPVAKGLAMAVFVGVIVLFAVFSRVPHKVPPFPWWVFLAIVGGAFAAAWILVIGYINADAGRRGMGRVLWTFIAMLVPNCLGILLYFLLRKPFLRECANCHVMVDPGFQFCQICGFAMSPICANCGRGISHEFVCCPSCGKPVRPEAARAPSRPVAGP